VGYVLHILVNISIYGILAVSFDLVLGYAGLFSVAHAAFFGMGAYVAGLAALHLGTPFLANALMAAAFCGGAGALLAIPAIRVGGDYLVIASFGFMSLVFTILLNWTDVTRGAFGLRGIPQPALFGWEVRTLPEYALLYLAIAALLILAARRLAASPFGRALQAIRENQLAAEAAGKNPVYFKTWVFALAGAMAGVAGTMYAHYVTFVGPFAFTIDVSVLLFAMVILGCTGTIVGPLMGAVLLVILPEALRFLMVPPALQGPVRQMVYGLLLVVFTLVRPNGLYGMVGDLLALFRSPAAAVDPPAGASGLGGDERLA
jgi:branched-chain amino acid transport system permease protein